MAVEATDVKLIFDTDLEVSQINAMLVVAENLIVTHIDPLSDPLVTTVVRDDIKIWLGAHFSAIRDAETKEESADGIRTVFRGKTEMGLNFTSYGQQVQIIDPTGKLSNLAKGVKSLNYKFSVPRAVAADP